MQYERMWDHMSTGRAAVMVSEREEGGIMSDTLQLTLRQRLMSGNHCRKCKSMVSAMVLFTWRKSPTLVLLIIQKE